MRIIRPIFRRPRRRTPDPWDPVRSDGWAVTLSLPWCCILPGVLSGLSLSAAAAARIWTGRMTPILGLASGLFLGRAFWLIYAKRQNS